MGSTSNASTFPHRRSPDSETSRIAQALQETSPRRSAAATERNLRLYQARFPPARRTPADHRAGLILQQYRRFSAAWPAPAQESRPNGAPATSDRVKVKPRTTQSGVHRKRKWRMAKEGRKIDPRLVDGEPPGQRPVLRRPAPPAAMLSTRSWRIGRPAASSQGDAQGDLLLPRRSAPRSAGSPGSNRQSSSTRPTMPIRREQRLRVGAAQVQAAFGTGRDLHPRIFRRFHYLLDERRGLGEGLVR